jgi:hypothetical protein
MTTPPNPALSFGRQAEIPVRRMSQLFRLPTSVKRDPSIDAWMTRHTGELGEIAKHWFAMMRSRQFRPLADRTVTVKTTSTNTNL